MKAKTIKKFNNHIKNRNILGVCSMLKSLDGEFDIPETTDEIVYRVILYGKGKVKPTLFLYKKAIDFCHYDFALDILSYDMLMMLDYKNKNHHDYIKYALKKFRYDKDMVSKVHVRKTLDLEILTSAIYNNQYRIVKDIIKNNDITDVLDDCIKEAENTNNSKMLEILHDVDTNSVQMPIPDMSLMMDMMNYEFPFQ